MLKTLKLVLELNAQSQDHH